MPFNESQTTKRWRDQKDRDARKCKYRTPHKGNRNDTKALRSRNKSAGWSDGMMYSLVGGSYGSKGRTVIKPIKMKF